MKKTYKSPAHRPLRPDTTVEENITTAGQRRVNLIWEFTQATVTMAITLATIYLAINRIDDETMKAAFFIIIGFYFSRTNHERIGGVGNKPVQKYYGR